MLGSAGMVGSTDMVGSIVREITTPAITLAVGTRRAARIRYSMNFVSPPIN
jgi:hypothetical protein